MWRESELGRLFTAVDEDGRPCVLRVLKTSRADELDALWARLRALPLPPTVETVDRWGRADDGHVWAVSGGTVEGTLADRLSVTGPLPAGDVDHLAEEMVAALEGLHAADVVHGGVSPSTIVWTGERWQLSAAGVAPLLRAGDGGVDPVGEVSAYASPDVLAGRGPTAADDRYALGLSVAEAYQGRPVTPWRVGEPAAQLLARRPARPLVLVGAPPRLVARIRALTAKPGPVADDDVRFTVYRPARVQPERWYTMLAFAHKTDSVDDPVEGRIDPVEEVRRRAAALLGPKLDLYSTAAQDSSVELPRGSDLLFVPSVEGFEFNPAHRSFSWEEPVHEESFRLRAHAGLAGTRARGALLVFLGTVIIAEVSLSIAVDDAAAEDGQEPVEAERARRYDRIFVSYSHDDAPVVERVRIGATALGHEVVLDRTHLRSGQDWSAELEQLIEGSDVFQLFWSRRSMASKYVRDEWTYALSLGRQGFVRPVYWEDPFPEGPDLPPDQLRRLHFHRLVAAEPPAESVPPAESAPAAAEPAPPQYVPAPPPPSAGPTPTPPRPPRLPGRPGNGSAPAPEHRLPHRRSRAILVATSVAAAGGAVLTGSLLGSGGGTDPPVANDPPATVVSVTAEPGEVCRVTGRATVRVVVEATVPLRTVGLRLDRTTALIPMDPVDSAGGRQTFTATVGPLVQPGPVRLEVEVVGRDGHTVRDAPIEDPLTVVDCPG